MSFDRDTFIAAFDQFYAQALEVAEECDILLNEQKKIRAFTDKAKQLAIDLRSVLEQAEPVDNDFQVRVPRDLFLRLTCNLAGIESALELTHPVEVSTTESSPVPPQPVHYTPSLSKRS